MFRKVLYIIGGLFFIVSIAAAVGLGLWGYRLNTRLTQSQAKLTQSQADYQALKSDYNALSAEYSQAKDEFASKSSQADSDLNDANDQVAKLEGEVKKLQSENNRLRNSTADIQDRVAVLSDFWFMSDTAFAHQVSSSDDATLKELYGNLQESGQWEDYINLMSYMIQSIDDASNVSWRPIESLNAVVESGIDG